MPDIIKGKEYNITSHFGLWDIAASLFSFIEIGLEVPELWEGVKKFMVFGVDRRHLASCGFKVLLGPVGTANHSRYIYPLELKTQQKTVSLATLD